MKNKGIHQSKIVKGPGKGKEDKQGIRCLNCKKRLFDGLPGFDILTNEPKVVEIICPRCGVKNIISSKISEKITQKIIKKENN